MRISEQAVRKTLGLGGAFLLMTGALFYLFLGDTSVNQAIRISRAGKYLHFLEPKLAVDPRFKGIKLGVVSTGSLGVSGSLKSESDLSALKIFIASTNPPVHVDYRVQIDPH
jgi:hypothetical protein